MRKPRWVVYGLIALAAAACVSARGHRAPSVARLPCVAGETESEPVFCGARVDAPLRAICALPGRTLRNGSFGDTEFGARVADASVLQVSAMGDSADFAPLMNGGDAHTEPCDRRVVRMSREWSTADSLEAQLRLATVVARLDSMHAAPLSITCGVFRRPGAAPLVRREASGGGLRSYVDVQPYRNSDAREAQNRAEQDEYLRTLKIILGNSPRTTIPDSGIVRNRLWMHAAMLADSPERGTRLPYGFESVDSGATACARLLRAAQ